MATFGTDPKSGGSYSYAERLTSAAMNAILAWIRNIDTYLGRIQAVTLSQKVPISFADASGWQANFAYWTQSSVASAYQINGIVVTMPASSEVVSATAYYYPNTGRSGLPGTMPKLELTVINRTDGTYSTDSESDASASVGAYEDYQALTVTPSSPVAVSGNEDVFLCFYGETGANSQTGLRLHSLVVTIQDA